MPSSTAPSESATAVYLGEERRASRTRARSRDRVMDRAIQREPHTGAVAASQDSKNLLLFIDDDLRESALALSRVEAYLVDTVALLENQDATRRQVAAMAEDMAVLEEVDQLTETLENMRRRMARLAATLRG